MKWSEEKSKPALPFLSACAPFSDPSSLFLRVPAIVLGLFAMASAYTSKGSRGYDADPKVVAAATLIYTATAADRPAAVAV